MARLEDLITTVEQDALREALAHEVRALKQTVSFGLVFERHVPEYVLLPASAGVEVGDQVRPRADGDHRESRVLRRSNRRVTFVDEAGVEEEADVADLLVVKGMGESVYPTLRPLGSIERGGDRPYHTVINGENYHALQLMQHCWARQVDCIYIDPPYNTGARDWKYNNDYVDAADTWRHSKWLAMMEKRLRLAKRLLKPDGVLIVTIDEHEVHHLALLLEQRHLFASYQRYMVTIVNAPQGNDADNFSRVEEHAFFCVPPSARELIEGSPIDLAPEAGDIEVDPDEEDFEEAEPDSDHYLGSDVKEGGVISENARRRGNQSLRRDRPHMFYPIYIDEQEHTVVTAGPAIPLDEEPSFEHVNRLRPIWPIDSNGHHRRWRWGYDRMLELIEAGEMQLGRHNKKRDTYAINRVQERPTDTPLKKLKTVWRHTSHNAGTHGSGLLSQLLGQGQAFSFPKSLYATRDSLAAVVRSRPDALIVDFFAGSGTTLHATLLMNQADNGRRRCVVVTNNEVEERVAQRLRRDGVEPGDPEWEKNGIFELAARPRVEAAITGKRPDGEPATGRYLDGRNLADGFEANCEFYELEYLHPNDVELGRAFQAVHPLLWLMAGARGKRHEELTPDEPYAVIPEGGYAVLFDERALPEFIAELNEIDAVEHLFLVTDSEDAYAEMAQAVGAGYATHMLYRDYLRSFRIKAVPAP